VYSLLVVILAAIALFVVTVARMVWLDMRRTIDRGE
jgi:hypothetical protein